MALLLHGAAFGTHPVGPTGRITSLLVCRIAVGTLERRPQPALPASRGEDPLSFLPRRAVADVLTMAALEDRHPIPHLVLLETDHAAPHDSSVC